MIHVMVRFDMSSVYIALCGYTSQDKREFHGNEDSRVVNCPDCLERLKR